MCTVKWIKGRNQTEWIRPIALGLECVKMPAGRELRKR